MTAPQPAESANKLSAGTGITDQLMSHDSTIRPKWTSEEGLHWMIFLVPHGPGKLLIKSKS